MNPIQIEKIENFANYCIDNNLKNTVEKVSKIWGSQNNKSLNDLFLELTGVDDSNYKTTKKKIYDFAYYYISDTATDPSYYLHALQISIYEQLHKRRLVLND